MEPAYNKSLERHNNKQILENTDKMLYSELNTRPNIENSSPFKYRTLIDQKAHSQSTTTASNLVSPRSRLSLRWLYNICWFLVSISVLFYLLKNISKLKHQCQENDSQFEELQSSISENIDMTDDLTEKTDSDGNPSKWIIIAFSDITYIEVAKVWYNQLTKLGYTEHTIAALDHETYITLKEDSYRVMLTNEKLDRGGRFLKLIWKIRLFTLNSLLKEGYNVMISDVDSIWLSYRDLNKLPHMFDTFHSYGTTFPSDTYSRWKFVVCGCIGAYRRTENTLNLFKDLTEKCKYACDDQMTLNHLLMREYNMQWTLSPGSGNRFGYSKTKNLTSMIFDANDVARGRDLQGKCDKGWIISPKAKKSGDSKISKLKYYKKCFQDGVVDDL